MDRETLVSLTAAFNNLEQFKELYSVGNYLIQPHVMHVSVVSGSENNSPHRHRNFEYSLLMSGKMLYQIGNTQIVLEPGDAVIIPADTQHRWEVITDEAVLFGFMLLIFCQGEGARQHLNLLRKEIANHKYAIRNFEKLADVVQRIMAAAQQESGYIEEKIRCLSYEAYIELFDAILPLPHTKRGKTRIAQQVHGEDPHTLTESILFYINDNSHRMLAPSDVSGHIGLSINHINHILRKHDGRSLGEIIWDRKLFLACNLLNNTNRLVKDIATSLGMEDVDYFCRRFKKSKGMSPSEYRMKNPSRTNPATR